MDANNDLESLKFLLFHDETGICTKLDNLASNSQSNADFEILDTIFSSNFKKNVRNIEPIIVEFREWCRKFICNMLPNSSSAEHVNKILNYVKILYEVDNSIQVDLKSPFINKITMMDLCKSIRKYFKQKPKDFIEIFIKLCSLSKSVFQDKYAVEAAMGTLVEFLLAYPLPDNIIPSIFECAEKLIVTYRDKIGNQIHEQEIVLTSLKLLKVFVRQKSHAIARLKFWWKFICLVDLEFNFDPMFAAVIIPFLANMFGRHISLVPIEKPQFTVYEFNVFTCYDELKALCHHAMLEFLSLFGQSSLCTVGQQPEYSSIQHCRRFFFHMCTKNNVLDFLTAFYFWALLVHRKQSAVSPSGFHLLSEIFRCISSRIIAPLLIKQPKEKENDKKTLKLNDIVPKMLELKNKLVTDVKRRESHNKSMFAGKLIVMESIISSIVPVATEITESNSGMQLLLMVFCDHLTDMNEAVLRDDNIEGRYIDNSAIWFRNSTTLINTMFPCENIFNIALEAQDIARINSSWFQKWFEQLSFQSGPIRQCFLVNLRCWYFLSSRMSKTLNNAEDYHKRLVAFRDFLIAPVFIMLQIGDEVLTMDDYTELWSAWQHTFIDLATMTTMFSDQSDIEWVGDIIKELRRLLSVVLQEANPLDKHSMIFNFICQCLRLTVLRCRTHQCTTHYNDMMHDLLRYLCDHFSHVTIATGNMKLHVKHTSNQSELRSNLPTTPKVKWSLLKLPISDGDLLCDIESNLDTFFALIKSVISRLAIDRSSTLAIIDIIQSKWTLFSDILACHKEHDLTPVKIGRSRIIHDKTNVYVENFLAYLLHIMEKTCFEGPLTTEIMNQILSIVIYIFELDPGVLSRSIMKNVWNFWNYSIATHETTSDGIVYPTKLLKIIKNLKSQHKTMKIPPSMEAALDAMNHDPSNACTTPASSTSSKKKNVSTVEIVLSDDENTSTVSSSQNSSVTTRSQSSKIDIKKQSEASTSSYVTPTKHIVKEKPLLAPITKSSNKRLRASCNLQRETSDTVYTVIDSPKQKIRRLTDHQKEKFLEQQNEYKPDLFKQSSQTHKLNLYNQDSNMTLVSNDSFCAKPDTTDIDEIGSQLIPFQAEPMEALSIDIDEFKSEAVNSFNFIPTLETDDKENRDSSPRLLDIKKPEDSDHPSVEISTESNKTHDELINNLKSDSTLMTAVDKMQLSCYSSPVQESKKKFSAPLGSPLMSNARIHRMVQMARDNQIKNKTITSSPAATPTKENQQKPGISRNLWSQPKTSTKQVSFNLPDEDISIANSETIEEIEHDSVEQNITINEDQVVNTIKNLKALLQSIDKESRRVHMVKLVKDLIDELL